MQAGISTATLHMRLNNEDALPLFAEWGVETAEVFLTSFCEYRLPFARKLLLRKGGVSVNSVHVLNTQFEPQLYSEHPRVRADAYYWLEKAMSSARLLGAKNYTFHGIARLKRNFRENLSFTADETAKLFAFCKTFGVRLCFENVEWAYFNRPEIFFSLKAACPGLGGVLDLKQARISGYGYTDYLAAIGENLAYIHVSDTDEAGNLCLPGRGCFDFDGLFLRLADAGFCGAVLIENYARDYSDLGELKRSYEFLAEKAQKYTART